MKKILWYIKWLLDINPKRSYYGPMSEEENWRLEQAIKNLK